MQQHRDIIKKLEEQRERVDALLADYYPAACSLDGRTFAYEAPIGKPFPIGSYVVISVKDGVCYFGLIADQSVAEPTAREPGQTSNPSEAARDEILHRFRQKVVRGCGQILGRIEGDRIESTNENDVFASGRIERSPLDRIMLYHEMNVIDKALGIGYSQYADPGIARIHLDINGFRRHTFLCGQSRSGKSFALGVMLERILLSDEPPRVIVLDPNSDFRHLSNFRAKEHVDQSRKLNMNDAEYDDLRDRFAAIKPRIRTATQSGDDKLVVGLKDLDLDQQRAVLGLDPICDLEAYYLYPRTWSKGNNSWADIFHSLDALSVGDKIYGDSILKRIANLGLDKWPVWGEPKDSSVIDNIVKSDWLAVVLDLGSLGHPGERDVVTMATVSRVWENRDRNKPILLVVDEAHNVCPSQPTSRVQEIVLDYLVRIAGEGLKYGIRLLLSTQRPAKVHANVISQCENLVLMRMNSKLDVGHLWGYFSQLPETLLGQASLFSQGEAIIAGEIVKSPTFVKFEGRLTEEGGADAPTSKRTFQSSTAPLTAI